jgi:hypothetical protein
VGINAKTFAMVARFRHACDQVRAQVRAEVGAQRGDGIDWARMAAECGYYDQAHLIHEFQLFAEQAPEAFARALR